jgi:hypothetical protein
MITEGKSRMNIRVLAGLVLVGARDHPGCCIIPVDVREAGHAN